MTAADTWIVVPNFDTYQHYKLPNPNWLRDYLRQLWNAQWAGLSLPQRGLLWTGRLAYAHHNGQLTIEELESYVRKYERRHVPALAERLNDAGLLDLVSRRPLSLKDLKPLDARARDNGSSTARPAVCPYCEVGAGLHAAGCPTLAQPSLFDQLVDEARQQ